MMRTWPRSWWRPTPTRTAPSTTASSCRWLTTCCCTWRVSVRCSSGCKARHRTAHMRGRSMLPLHASKRSSVASAHARSCTPSGRPRPGSRPSSAAQCSVASSKRSEMPRPESKPSNVGEWCARTRQRASERRGVVSSVARGVSCDQCLVCLSPNPFSPLPPPLPRHPYP